LEAHLLAGAADRLAAGNWQRGGGKGKRPPLIPRPGVGQGKRRYGNKGESSGKTPDEVKAMLARAAGRG
jgi:hypothetical protein